MYDIGLFKFVMLRCYVFLFRFFTFMSKLLNSCDSVVLKMISFYVVLFNTYRVQFMYLFLHICSLT